eukprot:CAMPEP_0201483588 /NCGR_PEP_ID=MMETSP0151_2-20130828/7790_1 /ASSEMBLY_ACC=CAM_ASM_000257 /TAXON_ID=200890 /ORGANISM="Paramoeba atlantica, Strain 621/1 / CCAP 1560/9" /LENGTH=202 /DNA_ID=CAMNT_0047866803 /DNA_START=41 /DNA_END=649 /DNA_ORIENTATION=+
MGELKRFGIIVGIFVGVVVLGFGWVGFFAKIQPVIAIHEPVTFVAMKMKGSFRQIPTGLIHVEDKLKSSGITEHDEPQGVGVFFDNPNEVKEEELRWWIGWTINHEKATQFIDDPNHSEDLFVVSVPSREAVVATFPFHNMFSPMVAPMRVYSAIAQFIGEDPNLTMGPALELYDSDVVVKGRYKEKFIHYVIYQDIKTFEY